MRVLQVGLGSIKGGIEAFAINYFRELCKQDVLFDFVDIYGAGIAGREEIEALGGTIYTMPNYKRYPLRAKRLLKELIQKNHYDLVHIHVQTAANLVPLKASQSAGVKVILHGHCSNSVGFVRTVMHRINLPRLRRADAFRLSCGKEAGMWLWGNRSFEIIPNAVQVDQFSFSVISRQAERQKYGICNDDLVIGFVGRLEPVKNPMFMLDVMNILKKTQNSRRVVMLFAGLGSLEPQLHNRIRKDCLEEQVHLLGQVTNINELLSAFDYFVMPSIHEAFSIAVIEAQANGVWCLLSDSLPYEMKISEFVTFLPLEQPEKWAAYIAENKVQRERTTDAAGLRGGIYDIHFSAARLLNIYHTFGAN